MSDKPSAGLRNAVIATVGAALAAVVVGTLIPEREEVTPEGGGEPCTWHLTVPWTTPPGEGTQCLWSTALLTTDIAQQLDLCHSGSPLYAGSWTCAVPEADTDTEPPLPSGIIALEHGQRVEAYNGQPQVELWLQGHPDAPWPAVCAPVGSDCEWLTWTEDGTEVWAPAPPGLTIDRERARGSGCVGKPDVELAGVSSMPGVCR